MSDVRTSLSHPFRIDAVPVGGRGFIGITFCPGKHQKQAMTGAWARDLLIDLRALQAWGAVAVISLIEDHEFNALGVESLGQTVNALGLAWYHLPIADMHAPDATWEARWAAVGSRIRRTCTMADGW